MVMMQSRPSPIIEDIKQRIYEKEENCLVVVVGKVRSGKSLSTISFCKVVASGFSLKENCAFEMEDFYKILNKDTTNKCAIMIEEMGLKADKRSFMTLQNKIISYTFQTFGYKCILLVMTVPSMAFIDSRIEHLISYVFETYKTVKKKGKLIKVKFKVRKYQHNPVLGKTYKKRPEFFIGGRLVKVPYITFHAPDEKLIQDYKAISEPYKDRINLDIEKDLEVSTQKALDKKNGIDPKNRADEDEKIANQIMDNLAPFIKVREKDGKIETDVRSISIAARFKTGNNRALRIRQLVKEKIKNKSQIDKEQNGSIPS
jgi:hypothetical protein